MKKLYIKPTDLTPEIYFSPDENIFLIKGSSSPEDVRSLYYPVIEWINVFVDDIIEGECIRYSKSHPLKFQVNFTYFNSSTAKFLYDILLDLKRLIPYNIPVIIEWIYDKADIDLKDAGADIASLAGMEFVYIPIN